MNTATLHPVTDYISELFNSLVGSEGFAEGLPYFDTATPRRATIGYGFNIEVSDYLLLVLEQLGIVNDTMTTTEINTRRDAFITAINNTPDTGDTTTINNQLRANLNQVASQYGVSTFTINDTQGYTIFREIIEGATVGSIAIQGKQERLDALLQNSLDHNSKEYVAVMSLYYNGESLVNSKKKLLANAIINDNRAEAWFEIRYNSNNGSNRTALAQRRYKESDLFGLLDSGAFTDEETKEVFRMFTKHQSEINDYEKAYPSPSSSAIALYTQVLQAKEYLVNKFGQGKSIDEIIVGAGLQSYEYLETWSIDKIEGTNGNDLIFGEKGSDILDGGAGEDVIYGGEGNDMITGGQGNDYIEGGSGNDIYYINTGDGTDTIEDKEGSNTVIVNGNPIKLLIKQADGSYKNPDGKIKATIEGTDLVIYDAVTGAKIAILNEDFQDGDFGIRLLDAPVDPTTTNTITGNQYANIIKDTTANDRIEAQSGNDGIWAGNGGANYLLGGDGNFYGGSTSINPCLKLQLDTCQK